MLCEFIRLWWRAIVQVRGPCQHSNASKSISCRSTMNDQKLNNLSIMNQEADVLWKIGFQDVIKELPLVNSANNFCNICIWKIHHVLYMSCHIYILWRCCMTKLYHSFLIVHGADIDGGFTFNYTILCRYK